MNLTLFEHFLYTARIMSVWRTPKTMASLLSALVTLVIADGLLTFLLVGNGIGHEGNPLLASWVGSSWFLVIKAFGALICAAILWDVYRQFPKLGTIATSCLTGAYGLIVAWNTAVYFIWG
ncbi:MAG: DUF5658 family protein [Dehalococcoidia bacterium]|nr:DUF5658 family protein [Dehalococcoidia bacterium]